MSHAFRNSFSDVLSPYKKVRFGLKTKTDFFFILVYVYNSTAPDGTSDASNAGHKGLAITLHGVAATVGGQEVAVAFLDRNRLTAASSKSSLRILTAIFSASRSLAIRMASY